MMWRSISILAFGAAVASAHPMGNFSVSHYARIEAGRKGLEITYALDLAELPTMDLLRQWGLDRNSPQIELERKAAGQARDWADGLRFAIDGKTVRPAVGKTEFTIADGAGNLPIVRITTHLLLDSPGGRLEYEDRNFPDRAGWKEIVVVAGSGAAIGTASQGSEDRSQALTAYPQDPTVAPPQDLRSSVEWKVEKPSLDSAKLQRAPVIQPIPQPKAIPAPAPAAMTPQSAPPGAVVKGDFLSRLLHRRDLTLGMMLLAIGAAFLLGAAHALTPGHGKTIVAAYLVGSRGTLKHAAYLGAMVTFTHTISVFALGLATLFLFRYVMPEKIAQTLGVISGLSIVAVGGWMLYRRLRGVRHAQAHAGGHPHDHHHHHEGDHVHALAHAHAHSHDHEHAHGHTHPHHHHHDHGHAHHHEHVHAHGTLAHSHGPGGQVHSHAVPDNITWGSLTALAVSGGLVPCESALVLLLSAIALGRVGLGLFLLVAFSLGLAIVLMAIGAIVIYAKRLLPESRSKTRHPAWRWIPVASAAVVMIVGLLMTGVSIGWVRTGWVV